MSASSKHPELWEQFRVLFTINALVVIVMMGMGVITPILPLYGKTFEVSTTMLGLLISSFGLARIAVDFPAGLLLEKYGRRAVLLAGTLLLAVGSLLCGLAAGFWQLVFWRFVQGAGSAFYTTAAMTVVADLSTGSNRGRSMALFQGSILVGTGLGPLLGGLVAGWLNYRAPFFVFALLAFIGALWVWLILPETRPPREQASGGNHGGGGTRQKTSAWALLGNPNFLLVGVVTFGVFFTRAGSRMDLVPLIGSEQVGLGPEKIGFALTLAALADLAILPAVGWLADHYGRKSIIVPANLLAALSMILLAHSHGYLPYLAGLLVFGLAAAAGSTIPAAYATDIASRDEYGLAMGLMRTFGDIGFVLAPLLLGWLADLEGYGLALYFNSFLMLVTSVAFGLCAKETLGRRPAGRRQADEKSPA